MCRHVWVQHRLLLCTSQGRAQATVCPGAAYAPVVQTRLAASQASSLQTSLDAAPAPVVQYSPLQCRHFQVQLRPLLCRHLKEQHRPLQFNKSRCSSDPCGLDTVSQGAAQPTEIQTLPDAAKTYLELTPAGAVQASVVQTCPDAAEASVVWTTLQ